MSVQQAARRAVPQTRAQQSCRGVYSQLHASPLRDISRVSQHLSNLSCTHTALHSSCSCRWQDDCSNAAVSMHLNSCVLSNLEKRLMEESSSVLS